MSSVSLNIGLRALLTAQSALDTIGHNVSNANTPGYSRQSLELSSMRPMNLRGLEVGAGVQGDLVRRTSDELLNRRIALQVSVLQRLDALGGAMGGVEALLGEPGGFGLSGRIDELFTSFAELAPNPEESVYRAGVTQAGSNLASQLRELAAQTDALSGDASNRARLLTNEVNDRASRVLELNRQITTTEAGGSSANDLRDQRDQALRELAEKVDITFHENDVGAVRVFVGGQLLVGPQTMHEMTASVDTDGALELRLAGGTQPVVPRGGEIAGLAEFAQTFVPEMLTDLDRLAHEMILEVNRAHSTGVPLGGGFTALRGTNAVQDIDGDGSRTDELLTNAGLPFDVQDGVLYLNVRATATDALATYTIEIDPERTTVADVLAAINGVDGMSAELDSSGRVQLQARAGSTFDFGARLDAAPDLAGTFGGGRASLGTGATGPFALGSGSTLDVTGPTSSFSVTFDSADFADINAATAEEVAAAINSHPALTTNMMQAVAVGDQVFLQTLGEGSAQSLSVTGGSALGALGWSPATVVNGHDTGVEVSVSGSYSGSENELFVFRPNMDGTVGTTPGLQISVETADGRPVTTLDVGDGYVPGTELAIGDGLSVRFSFGELSATDNDAFVEHVIADSDTSDVLVALGLNSFFVGSDASTIDVREDLVGDSSLLAASATGAAGDSGVMRRLVALQQESAGGLDGTIGEFYGGIASGVGLDLSSNQNALEVEQFLVDSLEERRDQISGVNIDEELVDMIQFEQAFAAASQYIQVVNSLNDEVLNLI